MQPVVLDAHGIARFQRNAVVAYLVESGVIDMNKLAVLAYELGWSKHDRSQFAQLIGYSVEGFADLSYSVQQHVEAARRRVAELAKR